MSAGVLGEKMADVATLFDSDPRQALKHHFGFDAFRPHQERIVADVLDGRDVFALLPTGGGKSLCFQLPAVMSDGLTVVVSPLIALMKDQVDALTAAGIPATFLNSSLTASDVRSRVHDLHAGRYRLLYIAPERAALPNTIGELRAWNVTRFAIDEAHCISEWGHDFRPEYRRLAELRSHFPDVPMLALTATATERVRRDIVTSLGLRDPNVYVASFDRPNLRYRVVPRSGGTKQLIAYVRERHKESGIVYVSSRKSAERLAEALRANSIAALPYHAGLDADERSYNQERFVRDDAKVICATVAFGMGIDKSNVRYVVHYDLPKSLEGYYQETGRAGRDGLAADCTLFFGAGDVAKITSLLEEKEAGERGASMAALYKMRDFAEGPECRRAALLAHFGEKLEGPCSGCDNCDAPRARYDGTILAQKFLSNVVRVRAAGGFAVGLNHLVDVLVGRKNEKIERWNHDTLSTYGIGRDIARDRWLAIGRELQRLDLIRATPGLRSVLEMTEHGRKTLLERRPVELTVDVTPTRSSPVATADGDDGYDADAFETLRTLRKKIADERDVPAYVIFPDTTLRTMARDLPTTPEEMRRVPGVGDKKLADFGDIFLEALAPFARETVVAAGAPDKEPDDV
jgi:ATP-dependent DNA helicase RecQ